MLRLLCRVALILLLAGVMVAQQKPSSPAHHTAAKPAAVAGVKPNMPSEETVNAFLQQMLGYQAGLTWKVAEIKPSVAEGLTEVSVVISGPQGSQSNKLYITADGKHAVTGEIIPFGPHPFDADRKLLEQKVTGPARGPADAPVTVVEFSDLQCPHCKEAQPILDKLLSEDKDVRLVFQHFPLPSHNWSGKAAAYADCVGRASNDAFWKFVEGVYAAQAEITASNADEKLTGLADTAGVKGSEIAACAAQPDTTTRVERSLALGKSLDVNSTPTLFINGRKLPGGVPYEVVKELVDFAAKEGK
ncbi:MAG TPA: thioredoxin domain-containing protein [Terriglobales bacterium]|jgi:protein-disulfide isomerase|nr:thioredoxin domain-containing protein [Terriglobales bacterium]